MTGSKVAIALIACTMCGAAQAQVQRVPEPETLPLIVIGVIALVVANLRRRK